MSHRLAIVAALFLLACGPGGKKTATPEPGAKPLCIDPAAPGGTAILLSREDQPGLLSDGDDQGIGEVLEQGWNVMAVVEGDLGVRYAVIVLEGCDAGVCSPQIIRVPEKDGVKTISARVALPGSNELPEVGDYPFLVEWMAVEDNDGDGASEVWVSYQIVGAPQPAVGATTTSHVAVFAQDHLDVRWTSDHAEYSEADSLDACWSELASVDADCDDDRDLVQIRHCIPRMCQGMEGDDPSDLPEGCEDPTMASVARAVFERAEDGSYARRP